MQIVRARRRSDGGHRPRPHITTTPQFPQFLASPVWHAIKPQKFHSLTRRNDTRPLRRYSPQEPRWQNRHYHGFHPACESADTRVGGAQGIGAAAVEIFVNAGAKVVFADVNIAGGKSVEDKVQGYETQTKS